MNLFNVFFGCFLALSTLSCGVNMCATYKKKTPIREIAEMLMAITTTADEFMKHLNILSPTAYAELVLHIYISWTDSSVLVCFPQLWASIFRFSSPQRDFARRDELQQSDVEGWLGFITFLCEVFGTMRSSSGEPFRVLVCPIYTCLREVCIHIYTRFFFLSLINKKMSN